ncbi:Protein of unknown function [Carnobacterium iners]|nr:Protein of unknown function [Carnobacterium iners]
MITGTLESLGYTVSAVSIALSSIPVTLITLVLVTSSNIIFDKKLEKNIVKEQICHQKRREIIDGNNLS